MCRYNNAHCRFGKKCCYKHVTYNTQNDTIDLVAKINHLEECIKSMSNQIDSLKSEIDTIKKSSTSAPGFKCDECGYNASSKTVLKCHVTTKHKHTINNPEKSRELSLDDSLKLDNNSQEIRDNIEISVYEELTVKDVHLECEYWTCQFNARDKKDLDNHITVKHAVDESFIYPSSTEEFECPDCDLVFMADHNFARHVFEEHKYSFTCRHCNKHLPGEDEMAGIHYKMCTAPCDGHRFCHCKL